MSVESTRPYSIEDRYLRTLARATGDRSASVLTPVCQEEQENTNPVKNTTRGALSGETWLSKYPFKQISMRAPYGHRQTGIVQ